MHGGQLATLSHAHQRWCIIVVSQIPQCLGGSWRPELPDSAVPMPGRSPEDARRILRQPLRGGGERRQTQAPARPEGQGHDMTARASRKAARWQAPAGKQAAGPAPQLTDPSPYAWPLEWQAGDRDNSTRTKRKQRLRLRVSASGRRVRPHPGRIATFACMDVCQSPGTWGADPGSDSQRWGEIAQACLPGESCYDEALWTSQQQVCDAKERSFYPAVSTNARGLLGAAPPATCRCKMRR